MEHLPKETIRCIATFLPFFPDALQLSLVNKRFYEIIQNDETFWRHIDLQATKSVPLFQILKHHPKSSIISLDLTRSVFATGPTTIIYDILTQCTNLKKLSLADSHFSDEQCSFVSLPSSHPNLEVLNLSQTPIHDTLLQQIIHTCPNLKTLLLSCCTLLSEQISFFICNKENVGLPYLEVLDITQAALLINGTSFENLLTNCKSLRLLVCDFPFSPQFPSEIIIINSNLWNADLDMLLQSEKYISNINCYGNSNKTMLHSACSQGEVEKIKFLVSHGADVNAVYNKNNDKHLQYKINPWVPQIPVSPNSGTPTFTSWIVKNTEKLPDAIATSRPIHECIAKDNIEMCTYLLNNGAKVEVEGEWTPLMFAVELNNQDIANLLLQYGANINARDDHGYTALHYAVIGYEPTSETNMLNFLLDNGANINPTTNKGITPQMLACLLNNHTVARFFLQKGVTLNKNQNSTNEQQQILPFHYVLDLLDIHPFTISLLLECGAPLNQRDEKGQTPLHIAASSIVRLDIMKQILASEQGKELLNNQDNNGNTPLHLAIQCENWEGLKLLLESGANVNHRSNTGTTPLMLSCSELHYLKAILEHNPNINDCDENGWTALHFSALKGNKNCIELLLQQGADPNIRDRCGVTPLLIIGRLPYKMHAKPTFNWGSDQQDENEVFSLVKMFVNAGSDINTQDTIDGKSLLHCLAEVPAMHETILWLIENQNANIELCDKDGDTPYHIAVLHNHNENLNAFFSAGANVNKQGHKGQTILQMAFDNKITKYTYLHNTEPILWPIEIYYSELSDSNSPYWLYGKSKPKYSVDQHYVDTKVINSILATNPDVTIRDNRDLTALHYAACLCSGRLSMSIFILASLQANAESAIDFVSQILSLGADINSQDICGDTPLHKCLKMSNCLVVSENSFSISSTEVKHYGLDTVKLLLQQGANVNISNDDGKTALHLAIQLGLSEGFIDAILAQKDVNVNAKDKRGNTCLHLLFKPSAIYLSMVPGAQFRVLNKLIAAGADTNLINNKGKTALHLACEASKYNCASLIAASDKTTVDLQDSNGNTALHIVCQNWRNNKTAVPVVLVKCGATLDLKNSKGLTPLDYIPAEAKQILLSTKPEKVKIKEEKDYNLCVALKELQTNMFSDHSSFLKALSIESPPQEQKTEESPKRNLNDQIFEEIGTMVAVLKETKLKPTTWGSCWDTTESFSTTSFATLDNGPFVHFGTENHNLFS